MRNIIKEIREADEEQVKWICYGMIIGALVAFAGFMVSEIIEILL